MKLNYQLLIYIKLKITLKLVNNLKHFFFVHNNLKLFTHACMHLILKRKNHRNDDEKMYIKLPKLCVMSDGLQTAGPNQ